MSISEINDTGDQVLRKAAVDLLTGGKTGIDYAFRSISTTPAALIKNYFLEVAAGNIPGVTGVNKFGFNPSVGSSNFEDVWDGSNLYTFPATAQTVNISSSSASDTLLGTGARTILIEGLDLNYNEISETIDLNGLADVLSINSYLRLHRMIVKSGGSLSTNVGNITAINSGDVNLLAQITALQGQTLMAIYTIPAGKTGYLIRWDMDIDFNIESNFFVRPFGEVFQIKRKLITSTSSSELWTPYLEITEKSDIKVQSKAGGGNREVGANFDLLLVDN